MKYIANCSRTVLAMDSDPPLQDVDIIKPLIYCMLMLTLKVNNIWRIFFALAVLFQTFALGFVQQMIMKKYELLAGCLESLDLCDVDLPLPESGTLYRHMCEGDITLQHAEYYYTHLLIVYTSIQMNKNVIKGLVAAYALSRVGPWAIFPCYVLMKTINWRPKIQ